MWQKIATIIVPAYNSEWCLEKCLSSLAEEKVLADIQVIVVNDGSADGTAAIAEKYAFLYPNTFSVIHKDNGGHGSCVNTASAHAVGKYIKVVDSDDWLINIEQYVEALRNTEADVVINSFETISASTGNKQEFRTPILDNEKLYNMDEIQKHPCECLRCFTFHGITYKTEMYLRSNTVLLENIFYEDQQYATQPFCDVQSALILDFVLYQYLIDNVSQSISDANQITRLWQQELIVKTLFDFYCANKEWFSAGTQKYFMYKLSKCMLAYYTTAMIKNGDKAAGRKDAKKLRDALIRKEPEVTRLSDKNYHIIKALNYLRLSPSVLSRLRNSQFYWFVRKLLR